MAPPTRTVALPEKLRQAEHVMGQSFAAFWRSYKQAGATDAGIASHLTTYMQHELATHAPPPFPWAVDAATVRRWAIDLGLDPATGDPAGAS